MNPKYPQDDIRDPSPPTATEEANEMERESFENAEYDNADRENDEEYYRHWNEEN